jgi:hypothetical protein
MVQRLESLLKDQFIFSTSDQQDSNIMVFVCGCPRACADKNSNHPEVPCKSVPGESDFNTLVDWLEGLDKKGDLGWIQHLNPENGFRFTPKNISTI